MQVQEHQFNCPFQLASPRYGGNRPEDSYLYEVRAALCDFAKP